MAGYTMGRPRFTAQDFDDERQRRKIISWLVQLDEQLRYLMNNLDEENLSQGLQDTLVQTASAIQLVTQGLDEARASIELMPEQIRIAVEGIDEFRTQGSEIVLTSDEAKITTPDFIVTIITGQDGEIALQIDEDGAVMDTLTVKNKISAPNIVEKYVGESTITVGGANGTVNSLAAALKMVNGKFLTKNVRINLNGDVYERVSATGVIGNGQLVIDGGNHVMNGAIKIDGCLCDVLVRNMDLRYNGIGNDGFAVAVYSSKYVHVYSSTVTGPGTGTLIAGAYGSGLVLENLTLKNAATLVSVGNNVNLTAVNLKGSGTNYLGAGGARIAMSGTRPQGTYVASRPNLIAPSDPNTLTVDTGSGGGSAETVNEITLTPRLTGSYGTNWNNGDDMIQGYVSGVQYKGVMWFDSSDLAGKTLSELKSAQIIMTRKTGSGRSGEVTVRMWSTPMENMTGDPISGAVWLMDIGTLTPGHTGVFAGSGALLAAATLLAHPTWGIMFTTEETQPLSGREYSQNYARFEGTDGNVAQIVMTFNS